MVEGKTAFLGRGYTIITAPARGNFLGLKLGLIIFGEFFDEKSMVIWTFLLL